MIILDFKKPHLIPRHNLISHLGYSVQGSDVETVIINGKVIMENREIKKIKQDKILKEVEKFAFI